MAGAGAFGFLIDTSAATRIQCPKSREQWGPVVQQGRIGRCDPTGTEMICTARSAAECQSLRRDLSRLHTWHVLPHDVLRTRWPAGAGSLDRGRDGGTGRGRGARKMGVENPTYHSVARD